MKKLTAILVLSLLVAGCSTTKSVHYYHDGQVAAVYTDDVFIGTLRDLGFGLVWNSIFRVPCSYYGPPDFYWNRSGPTPAPR